MSTPAALTLGVIADTHVPDRRRELLPAVRDVFSRERVDRILHAGDICVPAVLAELEQIAPVSAVRGNRDVVLRSRLPSQQVLRLNGARITLTHGHGGLVRYLLDKLAWVGVGYELARYQRFLLKHFPESDAIVFGHTHEPVNQVENGILLFNPGSACCPGPFLSGGPTVGILKIPPDGAVSGVIIELNHTTP